MSVNLPLDKMTISLLRRTTSWAGLILLSNLYADIDRCFTAV